MLDSEVTVILFGCILMDLIFTQSFCGDDKAIIVLNELPVATSWLFEWIPLHPLNLAKQTNTKPQTWFLSYFLFIYFKILLFNNKNINILYSRIFFH